MARQPFFGQTPGIQSRGMNMQVATQGARDMARGMANFGQAVGGMMQKFKAKKEKEEMEGKAEQALLSMGLPPEVAKAGSKDKGLISSFMQNEQIKLGQERNEAYKAGIKAKTDADAMQKKVDTAEAQELSAKRFFVNGDERDQTQAEKTYGNLAGFVDTDHENQPFGYYTHALKQVQAIHGDKETRSALDSFTGDVGKLMSGDPDASASWVRNGGKVSDLIDFMQMGDLRKARKAEQEKEDIPFKSPPPTPIDFDNDGNVDGHTLHTSKNSLQFISASGKEQRIPVEMIMNREIIRMKDEGDVDGLLVALRNQYRTVTDGEMNDVQKLPPEIEQFIKDAKENQKNQP